MGQKTVNIYRPKSSDAKKARDAAPLVGIEQEYRKLEDELMSPKIMEGKILEVVGKMDQLGSQLKEYMRTGKANKYVKEIQKYAKSLVEGYVSGYLKAFKNILSYQVSGEKIGEQKKLIGTIEDYTKKLPSLYGK